MEKDVAIVIEEYKSRRYRWHVVETDDYDKQGKSAGREISLVIVVDTHRSGMVECPEIL